MNKDLTTIELDQLENVTGGLDLPGIVNTVTGLFDKFTGGKHNLQGTANSVLQTIASFKPSGGGAAPQQA
jgi:hypothetical protein